MLSDLRYALRTVRQSPGFTVTALATLALGIATITAVFSVVNAVLLRPVAAPDPDRVVAFLSTNRNGSGPFASEIKYNIWREQGGVVEDISAVASSWFNLTGIDEPQQVDAALVTEDYFRLFGLPIVRGRGFTAEEETVHGPKAVILSNGLWKRAFGGDPHIVGKTVLLSGLPYQVIGILAGGIQTEMPRVPPDIWVPFPIDRNSNSQLHYFSAVGRLRPGVTRERANAQLQLATQEFRQRFPSALSTNRGDVFTVEPLGDVLVKGARPILWTLAAAVSLVLLIACANVANLLLVRAGARRREIAIRVAIGAGRGRILRQLLSESGLLAIAGAALGLALGFAGIRAILAAGATNLPRLGLHGANVALDWRVGLFTVLATLVTGVLFGLLPAIQVSRIDLHTSLKENSGRSGTGPRQNRARSLLVMTEMSLALLLLLGAALLIRTLIAVRSVNPGFDPHDVSATMVTLDPHFANGSTAQRIGENVLARVKALPGVQEAALAGLLPLEGNSNSIPITIVGRPLETDSARGNARWEKVSPAYFETLRIPLVRGRLFTDEDLREGLAVAIVNQAMVRRVWPGGDPLRDRLIVAQGLGLDPGDPPRQIVGIVGDVREDALDRDPWPAVYVPAPQSTSADIFASGDGRAELKMWTVVRTHGPSRGLQSSIVSELRQATGGLPVAPLRSMEEILARSTASQAFNMMLMSLFGACSLLLAAVGIYGLLAHSVQQRSREMGIRLALGAQPGAVRNLVVVQGMRLALTGAGVGVAAAFGLTRFIRNFLFGVEAIDPFAFLVVPVLLSAVALAAVWVPALRASRVDPAQVLREE